jgi:hypothetical protein
MVTNSLLAREWRCGETRDVHWNKAAPNAVSLPSHTETMERRMRTDLLPNRPSARELDGASSHCVPRAWRLTNARLPPFPTQMTKLHRAVVKLSESGLYALLLAQPATGLLTTLFAGRPFDLFLWRVPPLVPREETLRAAFHLSHELGAWVLAALAVSHAAAALFHHFVLHDDVLECMAPVMRREDPSGSAQPVSSLWPEMAARQAPVGL